MSDLQESEEVDFFSVNLNVCLSFWMLMQHVSLVSEPMKCYYKRHSRDFLDWSGGAERSEGMNKDGLFEFRMMERGLTEAPLSLQIEGSGSCPPCTSWQLLSLSQPEKWRCLLPVAAAASLLLVSEGCEVIKIAENSHLLPGLSCLWLQTRCKDCLNYDLCIAQ